MSNIHRKIRKVVPKEWMKAHPIQDEVSKQGVSTADSFQRRMNPQPPPEEAAIPMADEEELARVRRRRAAARSGGRSGTVLTEERFGS
jgi:hypothetical protein